jgi:2-polyprenyl-3-methyl-5-hydroxy-6-metoxy-1,4-benzoquinol methylase
MQPSASEVLHWDTWNSRYRQPDAFHDAPSARRMQEVLASLSRLGIQQGKILEIGCGTGWLSFKLRQFGAVTAVDLGTEIIRTAKAAMPEIDFRSGDIFELDLPTNHYDVIVTLETFSHVADQTQFVRRLARLLKPGGSLILTTQNKFVFDRCNVPPNKGYTRKWVTMRTLRRLLQPEFSIARATSLEPLGHGGMLRIVNSAKLNHLFNSMFDESRVKGLKERAGFGQTLFVLAVRR